MEVFLFSKNLVRILESASTLLLMLLKSSVRPSKLDFRPASSERTDWTPEENQQQNWHFRILGLVKSTIIPHVLHSQQAWQGEASGLRPLKSLGVAFPSDGSRYGPFSLLTQVFMRKTLPTMELLRKSSYCWRCSVIGAHLAKVSFKNRLEISTSQRMQVSGKVPLSGPDFIRSTLKLWGCRM